MPRGGSGSGVKKYRPKKSVPPGSSFSISWSMHSCLDDLTSLEDKGLDVWRGDLCWSDDSVQEKIIGRIDCVKIADCDSLDPRLYAYVMDSHSADMGELSSVLSENGGIRDDVRNEVGDALEIPGGTKLYVDHIEVDDEFRGLGLGLYLVDEADRKINDYMSLIILCPGPLDRSRPDVKLSKAERKAAVQKLRNYCELIAFAPLGDIFVARWNGYVSPHITKVCSHLLA